MDGIHCTLYPSDVIAAPFMDQDQALWFVKRLIGFLNDLYDKKDSIKPNFKKFSPVSVFDIYKLLPQTNCKVCGYTTCMAFAAALSKSETTPDKCPDFAAPISEVAVYPVFDKQGNLEATIFFKKYDKNRRYIIMKCDRCSDKIESGEQRELNTQILCEDCYMDALSPPKGCDPWAVFLGTRTSSQAEGKDITDIQKKILAIIKQSGEIEPEALFAKLDGQITQPDLKRELAALRHMEMVRGKPKDGKVVIRLW